MSAVTHHLPEEILVAYAAGRTVPAVSLVVACHATLCPECRETIADLEAMGGELLAREAAAGEPDGDLVDALLQRLDGETQVRDETAHGPTGDGILPAPLFELTGPLDSVRWKTVLPGVKVHDLPLRFGSQPVRLKLADPGLGVAPHGHAGRELDLVLTGGLRDLTRDAQYERGDMEVADEEVSHTLKILDDEPCLVLSVNEARMVPKGLRSRVIHFFLGW